MNNQHLARGIFCDLEKAFDSVDHEILLSKLKFYGITGNDYSLYESHLSNRYIRTVIYNDMESIALDWLRIRQGILQRLVLGPLLFLLYINDLPKVLNRFSLPIIFADDTSILFSHSSINDFNKNIFSVSEILNKWYEVSKLILNLNKTHIQFAAKTKILHNFMINYNNKSINSIFCTKFLGIMVDGSLLWKNHTEILMKKLSKDVMWLGI
jgi:hypothetical protein